MVIIIQAIKLLFRTVRLFSGLLVRWITDTMEALTLVESVVDAKKNLDSLLAKAVDFFNPGSLIDAVREEDLFECNTVTPHTFAERDLSSSFKDVSTKRYHMASIDVRDIYYLYETRNSQRVRRYFDKPIPDTFKQMASEACHGDVEKQETLVDTKIRKGKDLPAEKIYDHIRSAHR